MTTQRRTQQPVPGYLTAAACLVAMAVYTTLNWSRMPSSVITRQAAGRHGQSVASRGLSVSAMPVLLMVLIVLFLGAPVWSRLVDATPIRTGLAPRTQRRVLSLVLGMLSILLLCLHIGIIGLFTGHGPQP